MSAAGGADEGAVYARLKACAAAAARQPTAENIGGLQQCFEVLSSSSRQVLAEHLLVPVQRAASLPTSSEAVLAACMRCIGAVLSGAPDLPAELVHGYIGLVAMLLEGKVGVLARQSDETKLEAVRALRAIFAARPPPSLALLCRLARAMSYCQLREENLAVLGHTVSTLLTVSIPETASVALTIDRHVRLECLSTLRIIILRIPDANALVPFLPGILSSLSRLLLGDHKQGQRVFAAALQGWGELVARTLADERCAVLLGDQGNAPAADGGAASSEPRRSLKIQQTKDWLVSTAAHVRDFLESVLTATYRHHVWRVRRQVARLVFLLLRQCRQTLLAAVPKMAEILVALADDRAEPVAREAWQAMTWYAGACEQQREDSQLGFAMPPLAEVLEQNFFALSMSLTRKAQAALDDELLGDLRLLEGYLHLFGSSIRMILMAPSQLQRLGKTLLQMLAMEETDLKLLVERPGATGDFVYSSAGALSDPVAEVVRRGPPLRKFFRHFRDPEVYYTLCRVCQELGAHADLNVLLDHFQEAMGSTFTAKQAVLALNEILSGAAFGLEPRGADRLNAEGGISTESGTAAATETDHHAAEEDICMEATALWRVLDGGAGDAAAAATSATARAQSASAVREYALSLLDLFLEADAWRDTALLDKASLALATADEPAPQALDRRLESMLAWGNDDARTLLTQERVHRVGLVCLMLEGIAKVAQALGSGFEALLLRVLYPLLAKLGSENALVVDEAFHTLSVVCQVCNYKSISVLIESNADYLLNALTINLRYLALNPEAPVVLQVMLRYSNAQLLPIIADTVAEVFEALDGYDQEHVPVFLAVLHTLAIAIRRWLPDLRAMHAQREEARAAAVKQGSAAPAPPPTDEDLGRITDEDDEPPYTAEEEPARMQAEHERILVETLERCTHFLSSPATRVRLLVLDIVRQCSQALSYDEDDLLPAIHKFWPALVERLRDDNLLVAADALGVLGELGAIAGSFIRQRVQRDVLPSIGLRLPQLQRQLESKGPQTRFSAIWKYQQAALRCFARICAPVQLSGEQMDIVLDHCLVFLCEGTPVELQEEAVGAMRAAAAVDADAVWFALAEACPPAELQQQPADRRLAPIPSAAAFAAQEKGRVYSPRVTSLREELELEQG